MNKSIPVIINAPAKINLGLEIIGKRADSYHIIETLFQAVDLYDELSFYPIDSGIELCVEQGESGADIENMPSAKENIITKAADSLLCYVGGRKGVRITLKKRIPVGAGLGGGSSDAAAALKGIILLYDLSLSQEVIDRLAISLGADVAFFLNGPIAFGHGIGNELELAPSLPPFWIIIIKPQFSISTASAYKECNSTLTRRKNKIKILRLAIESYNPIKIGEALFNDLEAVCFKKFPVLSDIKRRLVSLGACGALMSGSGSSVFGLFSDQQQAHRAWLSLKGSLCPGEKVFLCRTIQE